MAAFMPGNYSVRNSGTPGWKMSKFVVVVVVFVAVVIIVAAVVDV